MEQVYIDSYKKWIVRWNYIRDLNESDIFMYGRATYNAGGDIVVLFDEKEQQDNYRTRFTD